MKLKLSLFLFFIVSSTWGLPSQSMRRCMLLPVKDYAGGAIGFKVFEGIENYLKESDWCYYRSNSDILDILGNHRKNLDNHLQNPDVLRILAEKTRSGSLIRITMARNVDGVEVTLNIIGDDGRDIYFSKKSQLKTDDVSVTVQTVRNWLDSYEKNIPYDARVVGVLGNQFTLDVGRSYGLIQGSDVEVVRVMGKKKHPLLREVVSWETEKIGVGKVFHVGAVQSQGKMSEYEGRKRLKIGDWVSIKERSKNQVINNDPQNFGEQENFRFGKLGTLGIFLNLGTASDTVNIGDNEINKIGGFIAGFDIKAEIWATRHFWSSLEIGRDFGSFSRDEGSLATDSNSYSGGQFKWKVGYKYLPLGFFYGPQVDAYIGYGSYNFGVDTQSSTTSNGGFVESTFKGLLVGAKGSMPVVKNFRAHLEFDFLLGPSYSEEATVFGEDDSASTFHFGFGGSYAYSPTMSFEGGLDFVTSTAKFRAPVRQARFKESSLKAGVVFNF